MPLHSKRVRSLFLVLFLAALAGTAAARPEFKWDPAAKGCEANHLFYSGQHVPGAPPCCPAVPGMCAGGVACPPSGQCPGTGVACQPGPAPDRPNVVLMITDDQGACHYGHAGECRSAQTGTAIPAPVTPNLDLLAGHGTVFPVAHNTAAWCFPSLTSIVTGRYQLNMRARKPAEVFGTVARSLRSLGGHPAAPVDPYNPADRIGGYCTLLGGKLTGGAGFPGFNARALTGERVLGRTSCVAGPPGQPPSCGSDATPGYDPANVFRMGDIARFLDGLIYRVPGSNPAVFDIQRFFVWYAPRIPHQPLRAPQVVRDHLFGAPGSYPLGGLMNLSALCSGGSCPPAVTAFEENNFGTVHEMYANLWWADDGLREIRKFLARASQPHCRDQQGRARFDVPQASCGGTWASGLAYDLPRETIFMVLSDNGWHLPRSKHNYTENGYRTRLIVFDPRTLATVPDWDPVGQTLPAPYESPALAHAVDILPTALGAALDTTPGAQECPLAPDGQSRCDGHDLRAHLATVPGGPAPAETLRRSLCGHYTQRPTSPTLDRYLLTRPGSVGRCTLTSAPACSGDGDCGAGQFCLGGRCMPTAQPACGSTASCPAGAICLGGVCRVGPSCTSDADCATALPGKATACVAKETRWCRNAPSVACSTRADCPACPGGGACSRLCEPRQLKLYVPGGSANDHAFQVSDLFLDPDENGLHSGAQAIGTVTADMSRVAGPYGGALRRAACCLDQWWYDPAMGPSICTAGFSCPADLTCNQ